MTINDIRRAGITAHRALNDSEVRRSMSTTQLAALDRALSALSELGRTLPRPNSAEPGITVIHDGTPEAAAYPCARYGCDEVATFVYQGASHPAIYGTCDEHRKRDTLRPVSSPVC